MATIFPGSASVGQIFDGYSFNGTAWDIIGNEFNPTTFSPTAPDNPKAGDLWVDSDSDVPSISNETILTINSASATYLDKVSASVSYLTQASASTTYQSKVTNVSDVEIGYLDGVTSGIQTQLNSKQTLEDSGWINVSSLANNFTAPITVAYRKLNGVVYLRGNLYNGTANTGAFTLPSGYRPSVEVVVPVQKYGTADLAYVTVGTDGVVVPNSTAGWLSGVCFPVG